MILTSKTTKAILGFETEPKEYKAVLTIGHMATNYGRFRNDVAVYVGSPHESDEHIAKLGSKISQEVANEIFGFEISEEDYRR